VQRAVLQPGQLLGAVRPGKVGACGPADDQGATGEHPNHRGPVKQLKRQMLAGMTRCGQRLQCQPAQIHLVALVQTLMGEFASTRGRSQHPGTIQRGQLHRSRQEVGMQVRIGRELHPQLPPFRLRA
jgi:hypothetical protein